LTIEYDSAATRSPAIYEFQELLRYHDLLRMLVSNSIKTRYKRSALGVLWTFLNPLLNTAVITIAFSRMLRFDVQNYPVYILSGLIFWNFFAQTTAYAMQQLVWGSNLIKRIYVPRTIFSVSVVGNGLVNLFLSLIPLSLIMLIYRMPFTPALLFLPVAILFAGMFVLGVSLLFSTVAVFFTDLIEIYNVGLSALFYLTPIIYPASFLDNFQFILKLNPIHILLDLFRQPIILGQVPSGIEIFIGGVMAVVTLIVGWLVFTSRADEFAYRI
jgi:ABC-type polysaccharide/polyol phosphate export permease